MDIARGVIPPRLVVRRAVRLLGVALLAASLAGCRGFSRAAPPPPVRGVVLVLADGYTSADGLSHTPALRRLIADGRSFEAAFAPDPHPAEARRAALGGSNLLPALFRARGAAVATVGLADETIVSADVDLRLAEPLREPTSTARLETWLRSRSGRFLAVVAIGGEDGIRLPPPAISAELAPPLPRIAVDDLGFPDRPGGTTRPLAWSPVSRGRAEAAALERSIAADRSLAALVALVGRAAPGSAIVVLGDPPPDTGAHGVVRQPGLFDDTLRATLVVASPGLVRPGRTAHQLVSTRDVAPTLLELAGLPAEPGREGRSLMPLLADPSASVGNEVLSSVARQAGRVGRSARTERFRYTEWPDGSSELYDHDADPAEITNLAARPEQRSTIERLRQALAPGPPVAAPATAARSSARPRNVLLVIVDDLNTRVGAWGAPVQTPNIDRLAAQGVRFDRAYVAVSMCSPSRVSMLTGWSPERTGVWNNQDPPRPAGALPLQEDFGAHGAATASVGKIFHFPGDFRWDVREEHPQVEEEHEALDAEGGSGLFVKAPGGDLDQPDGQRARRAARLLERYRSRPFFLALGLVRPHTRWIAPARYFDLYPPGAISLPRYPPDDLADVPAIAIKTKPQPLPGLPLLGREPPGLVKDPAVLRQAIAAYQACTTFADTQVGVVLRALDRLDLWRDTVVVLVGDNGYHLGEHGGLLRKDTVFEEGLHVPLIVVAPGLPQPGAVVRAPVEFVDIYPTILELAGLPPVAGLDGRSLVPQLLDPGTPTGRPALSYRRVQPPQRAWSIRTDRFRYTLWPDGSEELYDLRSRAGESVNLADQPARAAEKSRLRTRLVQLVAGPRVAEEAQ